MVDAEEEEGGVEGAVAWEEDGFIRRRARAVVGWGVQWGGIWMSIMVRVGRHEGWVTGR